MPWPASVCITTRRSTHTTYVDAAEIKRERPKLFRYLQGALEGHAIDPKSSLLHHALVTKDGAEIMYVCPKNPAQDFYFEAQGSESRGYRITIAQKGAAIAWSKAFQFMNNTIPTSTENVVDTLDAKKLQMMLKRL